MSRPVAIGIGIAADPQDRPSDATAAIWVKGRKSARSEAADFRHPVRRSSPSHKEAYDLACKISAHLLPKTGAYHEIWLDGEKVEMKRFVMMDAQSMNPTIRTIEGIEALAEGIKKFGLTN